MRILVTGANGDIGEAVGRILAADRPDLRLVGGDASLDPWPGASVFEEMVVLPGGADPDYVAALSAAIDHHDVDLVIPITEPELEALAAAEHSLPVLMTNPGLVLRFGDKLSTARWLAEVGIEVPSTVLLAEAAAELLPAIVKPRVGRGSAGIMRVTDPRQLSELQARLQGDAHVVQRLLEPGDRELTCGLHRDGTGIRSIQLRRTLAGGLTASAWVEKHASVTDVLHRVADAAELDGVLNVQLILTNEGPRIFEINPRLSSTVMMRHLLGFSDLLWWLDGREGRSPAPFIAPVGARVMRLSRELVVRP